MDFKGDTVSMTEAMLHVHDDFDEFQHKNGKMLQEVELDKCMWPLRSSSPPATSSSSGGTDKEPRTRPVTSGSCSRAPPAWVVAEFIDEERRVYDEFIDEYKELATRYTEAQKLLRDAFSTVFHAYCGSMGALRFFR